MHATDLVGYAYQADIYCPDHIHRALEFRRLPGRNVEESLTVYARTRVDRGDEASFDSGDFPKVIFADQVHDACSELGAGVCDHRCTVCREPLAGSCPNLDAD